MKLVEKVIDNISLEEVSSISKSLGINNSEISTALNALIPGVLSALKAKLVTGLDEGNIGEFLAVLNGFNDTNEASKENLISNLFSQNQDVINTLSQRVEAFSGIDEATISKLIPSILPSIIAAVFEMVKSVGIDSAIETGSNILGDFLTSGKDSNNAYEEAVKSANKFLGSIFGTKTEEKLAEDSKYKSVDSNSDMVNTILDLFEQDNDGSVMDDIYHMLVKSPQ